MFLGTLKQKNFFNEIEYDKLNMVLLLPISMVLVKCTNFLLVIHFINFFRLLRIQQLLIIILSLSFVIFFHLQFLMITLVMIPFLLFLKLKSANSLKFLVSYDVTSLFTNIPLQKTVDVTINLIFNHNPNLNITKKEI